LRHWRQRTGQGTTWPRGKKGKKVDLYSAYRQYNSTTKRSDVDHTELPANTPHLPV